jgi:hypothetical protein
MNMSDSKLGISNHISEIMATMGLGGSDCEESPTTNKQYNQESVFKLDVLNDLGDINNNNNNYNEFVHSELQNQQKNIPKPESSYLNLDGFSSEVLPPVPSSVFNQQGPFFPMPQRPSHFMQSFLQEKVELDDTSQNNRMQSNSPNFLFCRHSNNSTPDVSSNEESFVVKNQLNFNNMGYSRKPRSYSEEDFSINNSFLGDNIGIGNFPRPASTSCIGTNIVNFPTQSPFQEQKKSSSLYHPDPQYHHQYRMSPNMRISSPLPSDQDLSHVASPSVPHNLQAQLLDLDRQMEFRRGKSPPINKPPLNLPVRNYQNQHPSLNNHHYGPKKGHQSSSHTSLGMRSYSSPGLSSDTSFRGSNSSGSLDDSTVEDIVTKSCRDILIEAATHSLKAVELANTLRARIGTEILAHIRERWGGLLTLLEMHSLVFRVERIPKNDLVSLIINGTYEEQNQNSSYVDKSSNRIPLSPRTPSPQLFNHQNDESPVEINKYNIFDPQHITSHNGSEGQVSRCIHVGNVPANLNESQLLHEFERFGKVDGLKLVSQRNRRFAFISFRTIEQAIIAKHRMSRVHPWKSAIAFAHKESISGMPTSLSENNFNSNITGPNYGVDFPLMSHHDSNISYKMPNNFLSNEDLKLNQSHKNNDHGSLSQSSSSNSLVGLDYDSHSIESIQISNQNPRVSNNLGDCLWTQSPSGQGLTFDRSRSCPILRRLCDDTYVPTQIWPVDIVLDAPYCNAVIAQLQQFGGVTTISKLRGFLRNHIAATDNIKSVPLKSLLGAYPHLFSVKNNQVILLEQSYLA